jgi:hypothetical protein
LSQVPIQDVAAWVMERGDELQAAHVQRGVGRKKSGLRLLSERIGVGYTTLWAVSKHKHTTGQARTQFAAETFARWRARYGSVAASPPPPPAPPKRPKVTQPQNVWGLRGDYSFITFMAGPPIEVFEDVDGRQLVMGELPEALDSVPWSVDNECAHGWLPSDRAPSCQCWGGNHGAAQRARR